MKREIINGIKKVKLEYPDAQFIVFGSEANNSANMHSDLDICVVFSKIEKDSFLLAAEVAIEIRKYLDRALDIIVVDKSNYDKRSKESWTLEHRIKAEGVAV